MFNFFKNKKNKPCIVCVHGFGRRRKDEFLNLIIEFQNDFDVLIPNLYDPAFPEDNKWYNWVSKAEEALIQAKKTHTDIYLVGFSMGGVIASNLASKHSVSKLILIDPAFDYLTLTTAQQIVVKAFSKKQTISSNYPELPSNFTSTFMDVINNCKDSIENVSCPVLFIHTTDDEVIPYSSSTKAYKKLKSHNNSKCILLEGGQHRVLDDPELKHTALFLIRSFIENKLW